MAVDNRQDEVSPHLVAGLEATLKLRGENFTTYIRGWKPGGYIFMDIPMSGGDYVKVVPETSLTFRFVNEGIVLSCATTIMSLLRQPVNILVLDFPTKYEIIQMRKSARVQTRLPSVFYLLGTNRPEDRTTPHKATTLDLTPRGAQVYSKIKLKIGSRIALSIKITPTEKVNNILCLVKNVKKEKSTEDEENYSVGLQFQNLAGESSTKLLSFIEANSTFKK